MRLARVLSLAVPVVLLLTGCPTTSGSDPCLDVTCGAGQCVPTNGEAQCICNTGYVAKGLKCEQATTADVCVNSPCSAFPGKECQAVNGFPQCLCPSTTFETDAGCIPAGPCAPNPCTDVNRNVCTEVSGQAECGCNAGHAPIADGGCNTERVFDCAQAHDGGFNDDQYEPDECPTLARAYDLALPAAENHTIGPASDADWFKVSAPALHIIDVTLTGATSYFWIDVYMPDGITQVASQRSTTLNPTVRFQFSGEPHLFVRIKGYSTVVTGSYTITMSDVGVDDFTNDHTQALALTAGGNFTGNIQYGGDVDIVKTTVPNGKTYQYTMGATTPSNILIDALEPNGATVRKSMSYSSSSLRTHTAHGGASGKDVYFKARGTSANVTGLFDMTITDLGIDDHGDVIHDATAVAVSTTNTQGVLERTGDLDVFRLNAQAGHIYRFNCTAGTYSCQVEIRDESAQQIAYMSQSSTTVTAVSAKATTAGNWYIFASYSGATAGTAYTYRLEDLGTTDDHSDTATGATGITVGTPVNGNIEASNDRDFFSFSAIAQHSYDVTCTATPQSICSQFRILNAAGTQVGSTGYSTVPASANIATTGTYFVEMQGSTSNGAYTLTVTDMGIDTGDTLSTATAITVGTPTNGTISGGSDEDWYSFTGTAGRIYRVTCTSTGTTSTYPCYGRITNSSGSTLVYMYSSTGNSYGSPTEGTLTPTTTAVYYVRMDYYGGAYPYTLTVTDMGTDDHPNSATSATPMTVGTPASGNLQYAGDVDYLQFTPTANRIYTVNCTTTATGICELSVTNQSGTSLGYAGPGTSVSLTVGSSSATAIRIAVSSSSSLTGAYTLTVTDDGADDHPNNSTGASALTLGTGSSGNLQYVGDTDYFAYPTVTNHFYRVTCTTTVSGMCRIRVYSDIGSLVGSSSPTYGTATTASFLSPSGGNYAIEISGNGTSTAVGQYTVTIFDDGTDDHPNTTTSATVLSTTAPTNGSIQYNGDVDVFSIAATQSTIYTATCTSTNSNTCVLYLRDPSGSLLSTNGPGTNIPVSFRALSNGNYSVEVRSSGAPGTGGDAYTITLTTTTDDHGDTASNPTAATFGTGINAGLQYGGDVDVFSWTSTVGRIYQVTCTSTVSQLCQLQVNDATGGQIATGGPGTAITVAYKAISGGSHSVRVFASTTSATGSYTLTVTETQDDHGDVIGSATSITPGAATATAAIQYGPDVDVFSFTATATKIYQFTCTATGGSPGQICGIRLRSSTNNVLNTANPATSNSMVYTLWTGGTYYFEVYGNSTAVGSYTYQLQDLGNDDHGNSTTDATGLTVGGGPTNGIIEVGADKDMFTFSATAGTWYKVRCTTTSASLCRMIIRNPSGTSIPTTTSVFGPSTDTSYEFNPTASGTYSIEVGASNASGSYQIQVGPEDGGTYQTATTLTAGTTYYSAYMSGTTDEDWFVVNGLTGGSHTVTFGTQAYYLYTTVYDSTGTTIATGGSQNLTYGSRTFSGTGTFYIRVQYYTSSSVGAYTIRVQ